MVKSFHEYTTERGERYYTDALFRAWLDEQFEDENIGVESTFPPSLNEKGEQIVTLRVYSK